MKKRIVLGAAAAVLLGLGVLASMGQVGGLTNIFLKAIAADLNELTTAPVERQPLQLAAVVIAAPGTPVALAADGTFATRLTVQAGRATAANTALISICTRTGAGVAFTAYTAQRQIELAPADAKTYVAKDGEKFDVNDFAVDGVTAADGVRIEYTPAP
ncbi:MAG TPA: hypothetical protein VMY35_12255 [Phycisphaerae bacterium]|nr:hypothetical protein [Phycisphaerae bacterium]